MRNLKNKSRIVWLYDEGVEGELVGPMGAYFSMIKYTSKGNDYEILVENSDFMIMEED